MVTITYYYYFYGYFLDVGTMMIHDDTNGKIW